MPGFELPAISTPPELLEDPRLVLARDPRPGVAHGDAHAAVRRERAHLDLAVLRRVLDRVVDEIPDHLPESRAVSADRRQLPGHRRDDRHLVLREHRRLDGVADELGDLDILEAVAERPRFEPRGVEDVGDEVREPRRLVGDEGEERLPLLGVSSRHRSCSVREAPITAAIGLRSSWETSETKSARSAESRASSSTRAALGFVRADVLDGGRDEAAEQRNELGLVLAERVGSGARDAEHSDRPRAELKRRDEARCANRARAAARPRGTPSPRGRAGTSDPPLEHLLEHRSLERAALPGGKISFAPRPAVAIVVAVSPSTRTSAARSNGTSPRSSRMKAPNAASSSSDEASARATAIRRLEDVGAAGELVAKPFRLGGARD